MALRQAAKRLLQARDVSALFNQCRGASSFVGYESVSISSDALMNVRGRTYCVTGSTSGIG